MAINYLGGARNSMTFVLTGLDIDAKATLAERTLWSLVPGGKESFDAVDVRLRRTDRDDPATNDDALAELRITVMDHDEQKVGRAFSNKVIEMVLASYPGFYTTSPPTGGSTFGVYWPALIPADLLDQAVVVGGDRVEVPAPPTTPPPLARRRPKAAAPQPKTAPSVSGHPETLSVLLEDIGRRRIGLTRRRRRRAELGRAAGRSGADRPRARCAFG